MIEILLNNDGAGEEASGTKTHMEGLKDANLLRILSRATIDPTGAENAAKELKRRQEARALTEDRVRRLIDASGGDFSFRQALRLVQKIQNGDLTFEAVERLLKSNSETWRERRHS